MDVLYEKKGQIAYVTINRPEAMNAINVSVREGLAQAWRNIDSDPEVWVGIVTGAGEKAFSAGADLKERASHGRAPGADFLGLWQPNQVTRGLLNSKPMIAAINGYCLAGGQEIALACDIRIAADHAKFGAPEVKWNLLHGYGAFKLAHTLPMSAAMEMLLTGEFIDAQEAWRLGLVSKVVPLANLMPTAQRLAERICENGPLAVRATKELAYRAASLTFEDYLRYMAMIGRVVMDSEDTKEGPKAFAEKRKPQFKGR